jgi:hypothetical protein
MQEALRPTEGKVGRLDSPEKERGRKETAIITVNDMGSKAMENAFHGFYVPFRSASKSLQEKNDAPAL